MEKNKEYVIWDAYSRINVLPVEQGIISYGGLTDPHAPFYELKDLTVAMLVHVQSSHMVSHSARES